MANNRIAIVCKDCMKGMALAKYYPLDGYIAGPDTEDNAGWYTQSTNQEEHLNDFFVRHKHNHDNSNFGGSQYFLGYENDELEWKYE
jgi:hypothetical protein